MTVYKAGQLAKQLEITPYQLRDWEKVLELIIPRNERGHRIFDEDWLAFFRQVKQFRLIEEKSWEEINQLLQAPNAADNTTPIAEEAELEFVY